ncbi:MAG: LacI family DNA-binding transcriptional regulator [Ilumatobacteraceae bacterium]
MARAAGVSRALVSLVMRGSDKVSDRSREAVLAAAAELGYRPNLAARHLASKRTKTFGLLIHDLKNPYFPGLADGLKVAADRHGYRLMIASGFLADAGEIEALEMFEAFNVDGVILTGSRLPDATIESMARTMPTVTISRPMHSDVIDTVNSDDYLGARMVVDHLVGLGHRHICHLDGGTFAGAIERRRGYEETMRAHGLEPHVEAGDFTEASGATAAEHALSDGRPVTAIFAGNDLSALGALDVIDDAGLRVPDDVSLVGYDNTFVSALRHIELTTIDQRQPELAALAVDALVGRVTGERTAVQHIVIPPELVVRKTTAAPPGTDDRGEAVTPGQ